MGRRQIYLNGNFTSTKCTWRRCVIDDVFFNDVITALQEIEHQNTLFISISELRRYSYGHKCISFIFDTSNGLLYLFGHVTLYKKLSFQKKPYLFDTHNNFDGHTLNSIDKVTPSHLRQTMWKQKKKTRRRKKLWKASLIQFWSQWFDLEQEWKVFIALKFQSS